MGNKRTDTSGNAVGNYTEYIKRTMASITRGIDKQRMTQMYKSKNGEFDSITLTTVGM